MVNPYARLETILLIAVGGFAGANLRYFVDLAVPDALVATLLVNVLGSFALGVVLYESLRVGVGSEQARLVLGTGVLSSFTTFSTFVLDAVTAAPTVAAAYVLGSYVLGFTGVLLARGLVTRYLEGP